MKNVILFCFIILSFFTKVFSQYTVSGVIKNAEGEILIGANVVIKENFKGCFSNNDGKYILKNLSPGENTLICSFVGYQPFEQSLDIKSNLTLDIVLINNTMLKDDIIVRATRATEKTPMTYSIVKTKDIEKQNLGQDIPNLLKLQPSLVSSSDAGQGIGYSQFWIRGTDMTRINITLDGIPVNDSESHSVFWVDLPDFASSVQDIQIQRGVGTSTNGASAFGASVNLQTATPSKVPYAEISNSYGSFNTLKNTVKAGSGLLNQHFVFDARLSQIKSDGYIDRAWSDLKSFYLSGAYLTKNTIVKINIFTGWEETFQAWNGIPKARLLNDTIKMKQYLDNWLYSETEYLNMLKSDSRTYNYYTYENQIDHYQQDYYQMFITHKFTKNINFNTAFYYTKGGGYYEEYKESQDYQDYNFEPITIDNLLIGGGDLIRRKNLDNHFYGNIFSLTYIHKRINAGIGGSINQYVGHHFGDIIWAEFSGNNFLGREWYRNKGTKNDFNIYTKINYSLSHKINLFVDLQYRKISHSLTGIDDDLRNITQKHYFNFINPKMGIFFNIQENQNAYFSFATANREPKRSDFTDATADKIPEHETLNDYELGYSISFIKVRIDVNLYYMLYKNQLILSGQINDVGAPIMINVPNSFRRGIEFSAATNITKKIFWNMNVTLSDNKIKDFSEYIDNWDYWNDPENQELQITNFYKLTDISFSPRIIASNIITLNIIKPISFELVSKYVSSQYIDNTSNIDRRLEEYFVTDARLNFNFMPKHFKQINLILQVNNILNQQYQTYAWVYRYHLGGQNYEMDGYFPQAGINFMTALVLKF